MKSKSRMWLVYLAVTLATDGAALLLAFWLWRHNGSVLLATVPLILLIAGHMLFVAKGFAASRRLQPQALRSAYPQTSSQRRTTYLRELIAMRRMFGLLMPLPLCVRRDGTGTPILFVHGFICNAGVWRPLMRWLAHRAGAPMQAISLYPVLGNIDDYAAQLHEAVAAMRQRTGADKVMLVGHSMGGLVIRRYLQKSGAEHVTRVVTLGSPHHGVYISRELARWGANLGQM
ncbi:MAG: esterase/lipase family protein, partial [Stenotrophobium sp.]